MKIVSSLVIIAILLLSACGGENMDADEAIRPIDAWSPFVQVVPPGNIFDVRANEAVDYYEAFMARQEIMGQEIIRIYSFFAPRQTMGGWYPDFHFPDYFGGLIWGYDSGYTHVFIVEGMENEASEFLLYLEDFQTIVIRSSLHSYNELMYVSRQIWFSDVYPVLWWSAIRVGMGSIAVHLYNYTYEEKDFFREFVSDSPLIHFECLFETFGDDIFDFFLSYPPPLKDHFNNVYLSVQTQSAYEFSIIIHNYSDFYILFAQDFVLETYLNGRWIPIMRDSVPFPYVGRWFRAEQGPSEFEISIGHFTRQFEGPYRININIWQADNMQSHHLTYIF